MFTFLFQFLWIEMPCDAGVGHFLVSPRIKAPLVPKPMRANITASG